MTVKKQIILLVSFIIYLSTIPLSAFSLVGFWTDIIFSILFCLLILWVVYKSRATNFFLKIIGVTLAVVVFGFMFINLATPFFSDTFKMRSFYYQKVDGRIFHAYFKPVGAYSGGYGNFWITESPKYFPLIERTVYYDRTVHYDFNDDSWDGVPTDNYEVVREYIKTEVIDKK